MARIIASAVAYGMHQFRGAGVGVGVGAGAGAGAGAPAVPTDYFGEASASAKRRRTGNHSELGRGARAEVLETLGVQGEASLVGCFLQYDEAFASPTPNCKLYVSFKFFPSKFDSFPFFHSCPQGEETETRLLPSCPSTLLLLLLLLTFLMVVVIMTPRIMLLLVLWCV